MGEATIVVTNDDGIDSAGFRRLHRALSSAGEVVAVAPSSDQSAVGRSIDLATPIEEHALGYAMDGTPAACVLAATSALELDPDLVVSGINKGANLGRSVLTRSGTVSAAIEAAYLGVPAIAVSTYIPFERIEGDFWDYQAHPSQFDLAAGVSRRLAAGVLEAELFDEADYLNVNVPMTDDAAAAPIRLTAPADGYHTEAEIDDDRVVFRDRQFEMLYTGEVDDGERTDRGAIAADAVSVSPLRLPSRPFDESTLASLEADVRARIADPVPDPD